MLDYVFVYILWLMGPIDIEWHFAFPLMEMEILSKILIHLTL